MLYKIVFFFGFAFINNIAFNNRNNLITDTSALFIKGKLGQLIWEIQFNTNMAVLYFIHVLITLK